MTQAGKAEVFRALHHSGRILVLPNAWDVASAIIFERAGFQAIGTTSAGIAFSLGYPDGQRIAPALMLDAVARISHAVSVPVTADVEAGYEDPVGTAIRVMEAGAVGMNFEDRMAADSPKLTESERHQEHIRAICARTNLVVNARTDVFLAAIGDPATRFDHAVQRLNAYLGAGAGSAFAPGVVDAETIRRLAQAVRGPLNIIAVAGAPPLGELQTLGVARVSIGSGAMRATLGLVSRIATELSTQGTYTAMTEGAISYADVTRMLSAG